MELLEEIKSSLEELCNKQGTTLVSSESSLYIYESANIHRSIEGGLFWSILSESYHFHGIYDYITIIKLYFIYGKSVFKTDICGKVYLIYRKDFCNERNTLSDDGFECLCKELEKCGVVRIDRNNRDLYYGLIRRD